MAARVLLLMPTTTYKAQDFMTAAERLGAEVVVASERRMTLQDRAPGTTMALDFTREERSVKRILAEHRVRPFAAVIGTDDETTILAAVAGAALGLRHNPPAAVRAARDKAETRRKLVGAGMRGPRFRRLEPGDSTEFVESEIGFPCVIKPLDLSASRGVLRANDRPELERALGQVAAIVRHANRGRPAPLLVEEYLPGVEVSLEGLLREGRLKVLALFDKPDPLEGPTFEETIFVTPSRLPAPVQAAIAREVEDGCVALGLCDGPVHAELRIRAERPWILEVAPRTIGGLCARTLRFGVGVSLEELVLRHALGASGDDPSREERAAGVMMIPIPHAGTLREIRGLESARAVPLIEDVTILAHPGSRIVPLPEGHQYLGFLFARGDHPTHVEQALRTAHSHLDIRYFAAS